MAFVDIKMTQNEEEFLDISFENGDLSTVDGFESALLMSILLEKRASSSEIEAPQFRRGWWGNEALGFDDYEIGSKLWLLSQSRIRQKSLNEAITFSRDSLQWFIDDDFLDKVEVTANFSFDDGQSTLDLQIGLFRSQNSVLSKGFKIWQNTGKVIIT